MKNKIRWEVRWCSHIPEFLKEDGAKYHKKYFPTYELAFAYGERLFIGRNGKYHHKLPSGYVMVTVQELLITDNGIERWENIEKFEMAHPCDGPDDYDGYDCNLDDS